MKEGKRNNIFKLLENISFIIFMIIILIFIFMSLQSRITGEEPRLLGHRMYIVDSGSMGNTINIDSLIIVEEMEESEIILDDVITYYGHDMDSRVTHRVVDIDEGGNFITKGDANNTKDPLPLEPDKVIGKVVMTIPFIGKLFRVLSTKLGIALILVFGLGITVFPKIIQKVFQKNEKKENLYTGIDSNEN